MGLCASGTKVNPYEVDLSHFVVERVIGKGGFGKVKAVYKRTKPDKGIWYAMKIMVKKEMLKDAKYIEQLEEEFNILKELQSPFICNMNYAFQDRTKIYLLLDLALAGDLRYHMQHRLKSFLPDDQLLFYSSCVASGLAYLHEKFIIHRDLKPENLLLTERGNIKLIDFGISYRLKSPTDICTKGSGTRQYMAPEVFVKGHGHSLQADLFTFGVVLFEFLTGTRPYTEKQIRQLSKKQNETEAETTTFVENRLAELKRKPSTPTQKKLVKLIVRLLNPNPHIRKTHNSWEKILFHDFFLPMDFEKLELLQISPPFNPDTKNAAVKDGNEDLAELFEEDDSKELEIPFDENRRFNFLQYRTSFKLPDSLSHSSVVYDFDHPSQRLTSSALRMKNVAEPSVAARIASNKKKVDFLRTRSSAGSDSGNDETYTHDTYSLPEEEGPPRLN